MSGKVYAVISHNTTIGIHKNDRIYIEYSLGDSIYTKIDIGTATKSNIDKLISNIECLKSVCTGE